MNWISINHSNELRTPALLVDPKRMRENIASMIRIAGDGNRLWPHVKTHKMREAVVEQVAAGIQQFKAATLTEAAMAATGGAARILLAHQPVGLKIEHFACLEREYPETEFSTLVDNETSVRQIAEVCQAHSLTAKLWADVNCGTDRTGVSFGQGLLALQKSIEENSECEFMGLHVYDGHIHDSSLTKRSARTRPIIELLERHSTSLPVPNIIAGGTPTFPIWASDTDWACSPGTSLLWDVGYGRAYPDLPFQIAAAVATSVVSKLTPTRLCLDLGYKSVASESPLGKRLELPQLGAVELVSHSEEHLVVESVAAEQFSVGEILFAYPRHICLTVALFEEAAIIRDGRVTSERWKVAARHGST